MRKIILLILAIGVVYLILVFSNRSDELTITQTSELNTSTKDRIDKEIIEVKKLIKKDSKYDTEIGFFIDMKIPSGKNRFFIYNFQSKKIIDKGIVAHGSGSETGINGKLKFSNTNNSLSTSLGKYSIGNSYDGRFGKAYKLYGLDKTNNNAFDRNIVLHKYFDVPYNEQVENICNSYGCLMVNEKFFKRIEKIIDNSEKKIVMSIYY